MKNLSEIIENCKLDKSVDNEDLQYAVIALTKIANMGASTIRHLYKEEARLSDKLRCENFHKAYNSALNKHPKEWIGWNDDPKNPEYQKFYAWGGKLIEKAIKGELPNQKRSGE
jgi:hypothetical protein